jgi:hypothetical protein
MSRASWLSEVCEKAREQHAKSRKVRMEGMG